MTLKEYLEDYASPETRRIGESLIQRELENVTSERVREIARRNLALIEKGKRDFRF